MLKSRPDRGQDIGSPDDRRLRQIVAATESCQVGRFIAPAESPLFRSSSPPGHFAVVFPRTAVGIERVGGKRVVSDSTLVVFHNKFESYRRHVVDPRGDDCVWLWASDEILEEIVSAAGAVPPAHNPGDRLFGFDVGPCPKQLFLQERRLWRDIVEARAAGYSVDPLELEERALAILSQAVATACRSGAAASPDREPPSSAQRLADRAAGYLAANIGVNLSLDQVAAAVGCSKYHLCRVFRTTTGQSLAGYRDELRLRAACDRILESSEPLIDIALDLGFSSHSHMTSRFRRAFEITPSSLRSRRRKPPRLHSTRL